MPCNSTMAINFRSSTFDLYYIITYLCANLVTDKIKTGAYVGLFGSVMAGFGGILYALYTELSETSGSSSYGLIQRAVSRVESDQRVNNRINLLYI